ncbi:hypothetical protein [Corynebacterium cystitidis]|uniref:hypothetical protein n=1 Tax=Corynebacterium cystitidis TaxID=35757 RepID=UPI00211E9DC4|nr:hypothetical protein [Corynebacterium cystitidis]
MRRLRHVEVAPFDAGAPIISDHQWTVIASTMTELGWYRDLEFLTVTSDLLSNAVGV